MFCRCEHLRDGVHARYIRAAFAASRKVYVLVAGTCTMALVGVFLAAKDVFSKNIDIVIQRQTENADAPNCAVDLDHFRAGLAGHTLRVHMTARVAPHLTSDADAFSRLWRRNQAWFPRGVGLQYYNDCMMRSVVRILSAEVWRAGLADGPQVAYEAFLNLRPAAFRADLWRYMLLWAQGGVYLDAKVALAGPLGALFDLNSTALQVLRDRGLGNYWQGAFAAIQPRNPFLAAVIRQVVEDVRKKRFFPGRNTRLTGPEAMFVAVGARDCMAHGRDLVAPQWWPGSWNCSEPSGVTVIGAMRSLPGGNVGAPVACKAEDAGASNGSDCHVLFRIDEEVHQHQHQHYQDLVRNKQVFCDDPGPPC